MRLPAVTFALLLFFVVPCALPGAAQKSGQQLVDSMVGVLPEYAADTNKVNLLNEISRQYASLQTDSMLRYGYLALADAKKLKWPTGIADAYHYIAYAYYVQARFDQSLAIDDSILAIVTPLNDHKRMAVCYSNIGGIHLRRGALDLAEKNMLLSLNLRKRLNDKIQLGDGYNNVAAVQEARSDHNGAIANYQLALAIFYEADDKEGIASCLYNLAIIYLHQGRTAAAINHVLSALKVNVSMDNKARIIQNYTLLGNIYDEERDYVTSLHYHRKALGLATELGDNLNINIELNNISNGHYQRKNYDSALYYARQVLQRAAGTDAGAIASAFNEIGNVYKDTKDYAQALKNYQLASLTFDSAHNELANGNVLVNLSMAYLEMGNYKLAEQPLIRAIAIGRNNGTPAWLQDAYRLLSSVYEQEHQPEKALQQYKYYVQLRDSSVNIAHAREIIQAQERYDYERKSDSTSAATERLAAITAANHRFNLRTLIISGAALLFLTSIGFVSYSKRQKDRFDLEVAAVQQEALNAQMSDHFIGNTVRTIKGFIRANEPEQAIAMLGLFSGMVRKVLENSTERLIPLKQDLDLVRDYVALESKRFPEGGLQFSILLDPDIDDEHALVPPMIFQVLVENAIQHGLAQRPVRRLTISITRNGRLMDCAVEDNGIGRAAAMSALLAADKPRSFGSAIAEKLVRTVNQHRRATYFKVDDITNAGNEAAGTRVTFGLPYNTDS